MHRFNLIKLEPFTRINDSSNIWSGIDTTPLNHTIRHDCIKSQPNDILDRYQPSFYQKIACDLVVETVFDYPYPYVTEKTIRPIACKRMFIVVGAPFTLKLLRSKNFQTFNDFIDESYDDCIDPNERFKTIMAQVHALCARSTKEIVQYLKVNKQKLQHNFDNLKMLQKQELLDLQSRVL